MSAISIEKKVRQEKQLDAMQKMLQELYLQVRTHATSYSVKDREALHKAIIALDAVTLVSEQELNEFHKFGK